MNLAREVHVSQKGLCPFNLTLAFMGPQAGPPQAFIPSEPISQHHTDETTDNDQRGGISNEIHIFSLR